MARYKVGDYVRYVGGTIHNPDGKPFMVMIVNPNHWANWYAIRMVGDWSSINVPESEVCEYAPGPHWDEERI